MCQLFNMKYISLLASFTQWWFCTVQHLAIDADSDPTLFFLVLWKEHTKLILKVALFNQKSYASDLTNRKKFKLSFNKTITIFSGFIVSGSINVKSHIRMNTKWHGCMQGQGTRLSVVNNFFLQWTIMALFFGTWSTAKRVTPIGTKIDNVFQQILAFCIQKRYCTISWTNSFVRVTLRSESNHFRHVPPRIGYENCYC